MPARGRPGRPSSPAGAARRGVVAPSPRQRCSAGPDAGMVTAETAILLPALAVLLAGLLWVIAAVVGEVRCIDGAREAARLAARGDPVSSAKAVGGRLAPAGAVVTITRQDGQVVATVTARQAAFGGWAARLGRMPLKAVATATDETQPLGVAPGETP